jgi:methyl-accepting chemotaxis protein
VYPFWEWLAQNCQQTFVQCSKEWRNMANITANLDAHKRMENDNSLPDKKMPPAGMPLIEAKKFYKTKNEFQHFYSRQSYAVAVLQAIAFPSITAFFILSAYSFYLIQLLATDIHQMQTVMVNMNTNMHVNMDTFSQQLKISKNRMDEMVQSAKKINHHVHNIHDNMRGMATDVQQIDTSTQNMAVSVYKMQHDVAGLNKNLSAPLKLFNPFSPPGSSGTTPYVIPASIVSNPRP